MSTPSLYTVKSGTNGKKKKKNASFLSKRYLAFHCSLWYSPKRNNHKGLLEQNSLIPPAPEQKTSALGFILEVVKIVVIAIAIVIPIRFFVVQPFFVRGDSMFPELRNGDYLMVDEISYELSKPLRGDIVIFKFPQDPRQYYVKRIIGLPGETITVRDGGVTVQNAAHPEGFTLEEKYLDEGLKTPGEKTVTMRDDEYFVMGDNRTRSSDSRTFGPVPRRHIIGRSWLRAWPFSDFVVFHTPTY